MSVLLQLCYMYILMTVVCSLVPVSDAQKPQSLKSVSAGDSFVKRGFSRKAHGPINDLIDLILKNAKLLSQKNGLKIYRKPGGKEKAIDDFQALKPYKTRGYRNNFWHFALAGDRSALLKYENSEVTLSIWKYETLPNGERKRVMDKIMYGN